eukprot:gnl/TRDRNA2_/TRDRNA2_31613_c0_seq1.p1 gnl/TRDRNA2_/TRDRNA2_31613_c0~~gnl/TRDRNA2_/TRDRNA2_31613_c0_seq1.p1  ORF type:complete len:465 (+),score=71.69 gnl/TRDRNA2_/TRDRNA2_31613_c0_seq1:61-1395(+)
MCVDHLNLGLPNFALSVAMIGTAALLLPMLGQQLAANIEVQLLSAACGSLLALICRLPDVAQTVHFTLAKFKAKMSKAPMPEKEIYHMSMTERAARLRCKRRSLIEIKVVEHMLMLEDGNPKPVACERGAHRGITVQTLEQFYQHFEVFIKDRTMYYVVPNLVIPLTKKYRLSYAEIVGPRRLAWFVSHFWGHEFRAFKECVSKHAASWRQKGWKDTSYWICSFSNNQWRVGEELGQQPGAAPSDEDWRRSSFYLALQDKYCRGTAMIIDADAYALTRIWCVFELLQTVLRTQREREVFVLQRRDEPSDTKFEGLSLCTDAGVLSSGNVDLTIAAAIGETLSKLNIRDAQATSEHDKDMILAQVIQELGPDGFSKVEDFVTDNIVDALQKCLGTTESTVEALIRKIKGRRAIGTSKDEATTSVNLREDDEHVHMTNILPNMPAE